jgi:DhnA family fructose-bisphosphate aldolase class Ia
MTEDGSFQGAQLVSEDLLAWITEARLSRTDDIRRHAQQRKRRATLAPDGKLVILAADHPARGVTKAHDDPLALANRQEFLGRILRVLQSGFIDGLMATPDVIEEVLAVDLLGGAGLLEDKLLLGCMNRGGLAGAEFEMWDAFTAYDAAGLRDMNLDGGKLMFRLDPHSRDSGQTILWCAEAINACLEAELAVFLEPLPVRQQEGRFVVEADAAALARLCGIASALGRSSLRTWLKLPYCADYETVARATTCPILMLGGEAGDDPLALLKELSRGMQAGPNVRGALIGRNVLFPQARDPVVMAAAIYRLVHEGLPAAEAWDQAGG